MNHRVLFWCHSFWPHIGGIELFAARLLPALRMRGYHITVITDRTDPHESRLDQFKKIPVYRVPFHRARTYEVDPSASTGERMAKLEPTFVKPLMEIHAQVAEIMKTVSPHLVHMNSVYFDSFFYFTTAVAVPAPLLFSLHGSWPKSNVSLVGRTLASAAWITAPSADVLTQATKLVNNVSERSSIIVHGLNPPSHEPSPLPIDPPRILCVGRLSPEKGFDLAVSAFSTVLNRFPRAQLVIAGDGPERRALEKKIAELELSEHVNLAGWVAPDNLPSWLNTATLVVIPSRAEGFGFVALQAALMGRPVVATRVGGLPEVIRNGKTGLLVEPEQQTLAEAISFLLARPHVAASMGVEARRHAEKNFAFDQHVNAYDTLYRKIISDYSTKLTNSNAPRWEQ
jgi:glycogen(starch) synthase